MEGSIYITGDIGTFDNVIGYGLLDVVQQVKKFPMATSLTVYIDSYGGEVEAGFDIFMYLRSLGIPITTVGTGKVMSIATVIFMAGDTRILRQGCEFMIHLPWGQTSGTAEEIAKYGKEVEAVEKRLIDFYKKVTNLNEEGIRPLLKNETFLTDEQAKDLGFATQTDVQVAAKAKLFITNNNPMSTLSDKDKTFFTGLFDKIEAKIKSFGKIKALVLTAADGATMVDFADVADDATPKPGDIATIDGAPAEGEILMPNGETFVFAADKSGKLEEIKPKAPEDNEGEPTVETLTAELATANQRATDAEARAIAAEIAAKKASDDAAEIKTMFTELKGKITSKFKGEKGEQRTGADGDEPKPTRSLLKDPKKK
jgi:ATP-dependent Clp protease, protease subunit